MSSSGRSVRCERCGAAVVYALATGGGAVVCSSSCRWAVEFEREGTVPLTRHAADGAAVFVTPCEGYVAVQGSDGLLRLRRERDAPPRLWPRFLSP